MNKVKIVFLALIALSAACGTDIAYKPTPQLLPQNIQRLALRPVSIVASATAATSRSLRMT